MEANLICLNCKHFNGKKLICKAFEKGIPTIILSGESPHDKPLDNQKNSITFTPKNNK